MSISKKPQSIILIPARMQATRLPGKPLLAIGDAPMIVEVWRRAVAASAGPVYVACDSEEIVHAVESAGGKAVLTDPNHPSGSDRIYEALGKIDPEKKHDVIINLQGDMPLFDPALVGALLDVMDNPAVDIATLACKISEDAEKTDPNVVKAVIGQDGRALYFTRATAPAGDGPLYHHIGIYAYRRHALQTFVSLPPSSLERRERLEQLRALEHGMRIDVALVDTVPLGVDTPATLERARQLWRPLKA